MYFVVMPTVNLIVILSSYARYLYFINCPTVICLPSMYYFILWRDTTSELWTPVLFPLYCYHLLLYSHCLLYSHTIITFHSIHSYPLFQANRWDWQPHRKLETKYLVVLCVGSTLPLAKQILDEAPYKLSEAVAKLVGITFSRLSLSYWIDNLGFITEGKLAAIFIKTFSWDFPTGRLFILH
jgi:hypothetical protein